MNTNGLLVQTVALRWMAMNKNKSAKDIAWDKERAKYQKQIKDLSELVKVWQEEFRNASELCNKLLEENTKLKEALNLSEEDLKLLLKETKNREHLSSLFRVLDMIGDMGE